MNLQQLPSVFLDHLVDYLSIHDVLNLSLTCKIFYEIFGNNRIWQPIYIKYFGNPEIDHRKIHKLIGGYKQICLNICKHLRITANDVGGEEFITEKMYAEIIGDCLNVYLNLNSSLNSLQSNLLIAEIDQQHQDIEIEDNPKAYIDQNLEETFLRMSTNKLDNCNNGCNYTCRKQSVDGAPLGTRSDGMVVSKKDLLRRLNYLVLKTKKFHSPEDGLPGDRTKKLALRY